MEPFIGQIMQVGFNFAPRGWALCDGQLLAINQYTALFSLLGTTFGGDGRTTFGLPDLRGRISKHVGNGPGLANVTWGQRGGAESVGLTINNLPSHTHSLLCSDAAGDKGNANGNFNAGSKTSGLGTVDTPYSASQNSQMAAAISNTGGSQSVQISNPYLGIYHCIALTGIFPSRN
jgi:microcystin-dependent protein